MAGSATRPQTELGLESVVKRSTIYLAKNSGNSICPCDLSLARCCGCRGRTVCCIRLRDIFCASHRQCLDRYPFSCAAPPQKAMQARQRQENLSSHSLRRQISPQSVRHEAHQAHLGRAYRPHSRSVRLFPAKRSHPWLDRVPGRCCDGKFLRHR